MYILVDSYITITEFHLGGGGNWRDLDFKGGGMMVKDVTKF